MAQTIGGYEIVRKLGQGGMGAVFLARQVAMDRLVALKILPPKLASDESFVQRFEREARCAGRCAHPNLVHVHDVGHADGYHFFSMEYINGRTLEQVLREHGEPIDEPTVVRWMRDVARALGEAHRQGLVHRDVKPDNILITAGGEVKLTDLGLAKPVSGESNLTLEGSVLGTPHFLAPEQARGLDVDHRCDLYSLGATMYRALTGECLFPEPTPAAVLIAHVTKQPPRLRSVRADCSPAIEAVIARLLRKQPEQRYADTAALIADLDAIAEGRAPAVLNRPGRAERPGRRQSRAPQAPTGRRKLLVVGAVVLGLALLGGGMLLAGPDDAQGSRRTAPARDAHSQEPPSPTPAQPQDTPQREPDPAPARAQTPSDPDTVQQPARPDRRSPPPAAIARARRELQRRRASGEYDAALLLIDKLPPRLRASEPTFWRASRQAIEREATTRLDALLETARAAASARNWTAMEQSLDELTAVPFAAGLREREGQISALREEARRARAARAAERSRVVDAAMERYWRELDQGKPIAARTAAAGAIERLGEPVAPLQAALGVSEAQIERREQIIAAAETATDAVAIAVGDQRRSGTYATHDEEYLRLSREIPGGSMGLAVPLEDITLHAHQAGLEPWDPQEPDALIAATHSALRNQEFELARGWLDAASGHPLAGALRARLAELAPAQPEPPAVAVAEPEPEPGTPVEEPVPTDDGATRVDVVRQPGMAVRRLTPGTSVTTDRNLPPHRLPEPLRDLDLLAVRSGTKHAVSCRAPDGGTVYLFTVVPLAFHGGIPGAEKRLWTRRSDLDMRLKSPVPLRLHAYERALAPDEGFTYKTTGMMGEILLAAPTIALR